MKRSLVLVLAAIFLLVMSMNQGCSWIRSWGDEEPGDPAELVDFDTTVKVGKAWSTNIGDGMGKQGLSMPPLFHSGTIYAADHEGRLVAVDAENGRKHWEAKTELPFSGGPGADESSLYMGTLDGQVVAFDSNNGNVLWTAQLSSEILTAPAAGDGIVVVRCIDGRVFGLDVDNGARLWIYDRSLPLLTLRGNASLLVRAGMVFVGYDDGYVSALRLSDGSLVWEQPIVSQEGRTELERLADIGMQMVVVASDLIASSYKNRVASLAADSGRLLWFKDISSATGVQVDRINLAISDKNGELWMLDRRNGSTLWKQDQLLNRGLTRPAFYGSLVVVGDFEGYLHWLNTGSGEFVARVRAGRDGFAAAPMTVGNTLYVLTRKGSLVAYRAGSAL
jgi:outer membrane protein assembly factor BamB